MNQIEAYALLISKKPLSAFTPEEYHTYIQGMYQERILSGASKVPAPGLSLTRTKKGALSVRFLKAKRAFRYVLDSEIPLLAAYYGFLEDEVREAFQEKEFIIAEDRLSAERKYVTLK